MSNFAKSFYIEFSLIFLICNNIFSSNYSYLMMMMMIIIMIMIIIKGNFKRETESLLMAAQNSVIRTNHIKARIDKTQQNSKCRLCGGRDETINHIISTEGVQG